MRRKPELSYHELKLAVVLLLDDCCIDRFLVDYNFHIDHYLQSCLHVGSDHIQCYRCCCRYHHHHHYRLLVVHHHQSYHIFLDLVRDLNKKKRKPKHIHIIIGTRRIIYDCWLFNLPLPFPKLFPDRLLLPRLRSKSLP